MTEPQEVEERFRRLLRELIAVLPADYDGRAGTLRGLRHAFHDEIAAALTPGLNARLRDLDEESLESRRELCVWANEQLRDLGLAVRCSRTGQPSHMAADLRDQDDDKGRFRLEHRDESGRLVRTLSSASLPQVELIEQAPRLEAFARTFRRDREDRSR